MNNKIRLNKVKLLKSIIYDREVKNKDEIILCDYFFAHHLVENGFGIHVINEDVKNVDFTNSLSDEFKPINKEQDLNLKKRKK